jgi:acyl-CoA thioesterase-1
MFLLFLLGCPTWGYAKHAAINILILGDSLSAAYNIPIEKGWTRIFTDNISGETTFGGLQRLPQLLQEHQPTHLIIELGGNDGLRGLGFDQSSDNLRQMVQLAQAQQVEILLIGVRMPPNFGAAYNTRFQQVFERIAAETEVHYLPKFLDGVAASDPALMQQDGIHPTALAQPLLAQKVETRMRAILNH